MLREYTKEQYNELIGKNFKVGKFACKHCGKAVIDDELIHAVDEFVRASGVKINITSGYRCPHHNKQVGGASNSEHLKTTAIDFTMNGVAKAVKMFNLGVKYFNRFGIYQSSGSPYYAYFHGDMKNSHLYWVSFMYKGKRKYVYFNTSEEAVKYMKNDTLHPWFEMKV